MGSGKGLGLGGSVRPVSGSVVVALILLMGGCNSSGSITATPGFGSDTHFESAQTFPMASSPQSVSALDDGSWTSFFFEGEDSLNQKDALIAFAISQGLTDTDDIVTLANMLRDPDTAPITPEDVTGQGEDPVQVADFNGNGIPGEIEDAAVLFVVQQPEFADLMPEELESVIFEQLGINAEIDPDAMIPRLPSPTPTPTPTGTPIPTPTPTSNPLFSVFEINQTDDTGEAIVNGLIQIDNPQQGVITESQISNFVIFLEDNAGSSLLDPSNSTLTADDSLSLDGNDLFLLIETSLQIADSTFVNILFGGDFLGEDGVADVSLTINGSTFEATGQQGDPFATFCRNDTSLEDGLNLDPIFTDGFESGDTTAWCDQAP